MLKMNLAVVLSVLCMCLLSTVAAESVEEQFNDWMVKYDKEYSTEQETQTRLKIFSENLNLINKHNEDNTQSYKMAVNQFADLSEREFHNMYLMEPQHCSATTSRHTLSPVKEPPAAIDWRRAGAITPVKNQGSCGSCWTFSTTGCLEAHHFLSTKQLISLSEQQLVDCAKAFNNNGCGGGLPSQAFEYIHYNDGLESEKAYPYKGEDEKCIFNDSLVVAKVKDVFNITAQDENQLHNVVGTVGPVSIAYDVAFTFQFYSHGVYSSHLCSSKPNHVNHAVLAVGYNTTESGEKYWIVKNSWGAGWGMNGYFWIARGENMCGLADCASYPIV